MSRMTGKAAERQRNAFGKIRLLGSFVLSFVLILGVYYFFYVEKKSSYLVSRNFRFLATMGAQVQASLQSQGKVLENLTKKSEFVDLLTLDPKVMLDPKAELKLNTTELLRQRRALLEALAPLFENVKVDSNKSDSLSPQHPQPNELKLENGEYALEFSSELQTFADHHLHGTISLAKLLDPLLRLDVFDSVLLADEEGKVFYQKGAPDLGTAHLAALLDTAEERRRPEASVNGEGTKDKRTGEAVEDHRLSLFSASEFRDVRLSGREYRLFVEPVILPIWENKEVPDAPRVNHRNHRHVWLVCGLVPKRDLFYRSFAVSSAVVGSILGLLVLTVLSWPFVKLSLLGERQRVRVFDVLLLSVCSLLGIAVLTLLLCDVAAYESLRGTSEVQLHRLADEIEDHLRKEIAQGYWQLTELEATLNEKRAQIDPKGEGQANILEKVPFKEYPFADTFMALDDSGMQRIKWATGIVVPPRISVDVRNYFKWSKQGETWQFSDPIGRSVGPFVLQSTVGLTDGTREGVIAKPARPGSAYSVVALSLPMISVIDPVLPPRFEFAVIDDEGQVLFHSDRQRNLTENFFAETDQDRRLQAAVFARRPETLSIRYWGEDYLARVAPVQGMPWTVVALRDQRLLRAVNVDWITAAALFVGIYLGTIALGLTLFTIARPAYRAPWLWPDPAHASDYVQLAAGLGILSAAFAWIIQLARGEALLWIGVLVPAVTWIGAYLKLGASGNRKWAAQGVGLLCLLFLFGSIVDGDGEARRNAQVIGSFLLLLAGCAVALFPFERAVWLKKRWKRILEDRVLATQTYPAAGVLLLILTAVLPT
ncbi:MAG TPA: cache domain-containing protein, partial [Thermoanaerobaculia bacterium]|nr:cache domain-containing protein [Thermoanaerobaculia bacterium]